MTITITDPRFGSNNGFSIYAATISITAPAADSFTVPFNTIVSAQGTYSEAGGTSEIILVKSGDTITVSGDTDKDIDVLVFGT